MAAVLALHTTEELLVTERTRNDVLRELAQSDHGVFTQLMRDLEPHPLQRGKLLGTPRVVSNFLYFIDSGVVSLVANTKSGHSVEVALVGREGVAGIADALGNHPLPYSLVVQLPGLAYRAPKELIRKHILSCSALHELLMNYSQRVMHQLAQSALCNRFHTSVQRLHDGSCSPLSGRTRIASSSRMNSWRRWSAPPAPLSASPPRRCETKGSSTIAAVCSHPKREATPQGRVRMLRRGVLDDKWRSHPAGRSE